MRPIPIGIDFGTTKSSVGISFQGKVEIIQNEQGCTSTPSCVAFTDSALLVGAPALDQITTNIENTVVGIKRVLGHAFDNLTLESYVKSSAVKIVKGNDALPKFNVEYLNKRKEFCPEEAASFIISKLKDTAETYLKVNSSPTFEVEHVAIAVPLFFTGSERQALANAATLAGVKAHLISEPIAAAIACGIYNKYDGAGRNVLVFDIGGGKTEATVLTTERKGETETYTVKGTASNCNIGGADFDNILINHFKSELKLNLNGKRDIERLRKACESVKKQLSILRRAKVETYLEGNECNILLTRQTFEYSCSNLFETAVGLVNDALCMANMDKTKIDDLVLIGGCTRIPMIQDLFFKTFPGKAIESINPDEAIVRGAAAYHEMLCHQQKVAVNEILSKPIWIHTAISTGVRTKTRILDSCTRIPFKSNLEFPLQHNQSMRAWVYQGEPVRLELLTFFYIVGWQKGCSSVNVLLRIDEDRRLTFSQENISTGSGNSIPCSRGGCISQLNVDRMATEQRAERERLSARKALELCVYDLQGKYDSLPENAKNCLQDTSKFLDSSISFHAPKEKFEGKMTLLMDHLRKVTVSKQITRQENRSFEGHAQPRSLSRRKAEIPNEVGKLHEKRIKPEHNHTKLEEKYNTEHETKMRMRYTPQSSSFPTQATNPLDSSSNQSEQAELCQSMEKVELDERETTKIPNELIVDKQNTANAHTTQTRSVSSPKPAPQVRELEKTAKSVTQQGGTTTQHENMLPDSDEVQNTRSRMAEQREQGASVQQNLLKLKQDDCTPSYCPDPNSTTGGHKKPMSVTGPVERIHKSLDARDNVLAESGNAVPKVKDARADQEPYDYMRERQQEFREEPAISNKKVVDVNKKATTMNCTTYHFCKSLFAKYIGLVHHNNSENTIERTVSSERKAAPNYGTHRTCHFKQKSR